MESHIQVSEEDFKRVQFFMNNYELIQKYELIKDRIVLGNKERVCRICQKRKPEVSFKMKAHAIPEFIGNKLLIVTCIPVHS